MSNSFMTLDASALVPASRRKDPVRPSVGRLLIEVKVKPGRVALPNVSGAVRHGVQQVEIYADDLPKVESMVEDLPEELERAKARSAAVRDRQVETQMQGMEFEHEVDRQREEARLRKRLYATNYSAEYTQATGRKLGPKPLEYCKVIKELDALKDEQTSLAVQIAKELAAVSAAQKDAELDNMRAEMAAMKELVREMKRTVDKTRNK